MKQRKDRIKPKRKTSKSSKSSNVKKQKVKKSAKKKSEIDYDALIHAVAGKGIGSGFEIDGLDGFGEDESDYVPFNLPVPGYSFWTALTVCRLFWHTWWDAPTGEMCFWCHKKRSTKDWIRQI